MINVIVYIACMLQLFSLTGVSSTKQCVNCDPEITSMISMAGAACKGQEPIKIDDVSLCKSVEIKDISTMGLKPNTSCLSRVKKNNYFQTMTIQFKVVNIDCLVHDAKKLLQDAAKDAGMPMPIIPAIGVDMSTFHIMGEWVGLTVILNVSLDMDTCNHEVAEVIITDGSLGALKLWCKGDQFLCKSCEMITHPDFVKASFGFIVKFFIKGPLCDVFRSGDLKEAMTGLTCAEVEYD